MTIQLSTEYGSRHQPIRLRHYQGQRGEDKDKAAEISQGS
jgi:hypothetical protein